MNKKMSVREIRVRAKPDRGALNCVIDYSWHRALLNELAAMTIRLVRTSRMGVQRSDCVQTGLCYKRAILRVNSYRKKHKWDPIGVYSHEFWGIACRITDRRVIGC